MQHNCPNCEKELSHLKAEHGIFWGCPLCLGRSIGVGLLRKISNPEVISRLWVRAREINLANGKKCPSCARPMLIVSMGEASDTVQLDVCTSCYLIWFDQSEIQRLPRASNAEIHQRERALEPKQAATSPSNGQASSLDSDLLPSLSFAFSTWFS